MTSLDLLGLKHKENNGLHQIEIIKNKCEKENCELCYIHLNLGETWYKNLQDEFSTKYMKDILKFLHSENDFFPSLENVFRFSNFFEFDRTKVVIIGQDPYHNDGQANGLSFSVHKGQRIPPSLRNIYKELNATLDGFEIPTHGSLESWAEQGVLLLNDSLTVKKNSPNSHSKIGWSAFTNRIIMCLSSNLSNVVFILWGANAYKKVGLIDTTKHLVLKSAHPSPFSANRGFFGCNHFMRCNEYLIKYEKEPIDWRIF